MALGASFQRIMVLTLAGYSTWWVQPSAVDTKFVKPRPGAQPVDMPGLHNVIHVSDRLYSGRGPEDDSGFDSLVKLGIKTIISVDGARPDAACARKFGIRYVHLPIGYEGISQDQAMKLARAVRDLDGPIYIHCHHGKHRSPAAAAAIQICLDDKCTVPQAVDIMKRAGTDPRYTGLFAGPKELKRTTSAQLDQVKVEFRDAAPIAAVAEVMVQIDRYWEHLSLVRKAGWKAPIGYPDLDPTHEALQLREHFRELARLPNTQKRPADFKQWMVEAEKAAHDLEDALRVKAKQRDGVEAAAKAYERSHALCSQCHAKYRDVPQSP